MIYELFAQPIHEDGSIGFDGRPPLFLSAASLADVFAHMAGDDGIGPYVNKFDTWDLTLTIRVI